MHCSQERIRRENYGSCTPCSHNNIYKATCVTESQGDLSVVHPKKEEYYVGCRVLYACSIKICMICKCGLNHIKQVEAFKFEKKKTDYTNPKCSFNRHSHCLQKMEHSFVTRLK